MKITPHPAIDQLLEELLSHMKTILGEKLVGLYLYGSLVAGDFDYEISDIDLLAAVKEDINDQEFTALQKMHADFVRKHTAWDDRIEVQYYSLFGLKNFKTQARKMVNISPGEPLHTAPAGIQWLTNWYFVQDYGITLFGPAPATIIDHTTKEEFMVAVREHALEWVEYIQNTRSSIKYQAYAILTLCRALYTSKTGELVSKQKAAAWARKEFPQWASLIQNALEWRMATKDTADPEVTFPVAKQFVTFIIDQI